LAGARRQFGWADQTGAARQPPPARTAQPARRDPAAVSARPASRQARFAAADEPAAGFLVVNELTVLQCKDGATCLPRRPASKRRRDEFPQLLPPPRKEPARRGVHRLEIGGRLRCSASHRAAPAP